MPGITWGKDTREDRAGSKDFTGEVMPSWVLKDDWDFARLTR